MTDLVSVSESRSQGARPPSRVRLRAMHAEDIPAGLRLCRASHWNQVARDWELFLTMSPEGCRLAVDERGEVIGSVATVRYGASLSWVAMVLVDPARRGEGVGTLLLEDALHRLEGVPVVRLDATAAGRGVYLRSGFREEYRLQRLERHAQPHSGGHALAAAPDAERLVRPMQDADLDAVFALDRRVFGADRHELLDAFRHGAPEYAWVAGHDAIDGFLLGRHGHAFEHLGPLVAADETTARRLVGRCLAAHDDRSFILDAPPHDTWIEWLGACRFTPQRPFIRMCRGAHSHQERLDCLFAIAGAEFS